MALIFHFMIAILQFALLIRALSTTHCCDVGNITQMREHRRISQVRGGPKPPGPVAILMAYQKANVDPPAHVVEAADAARKKTSSVQGYDAGSDSTWLFPITIGESQLTAVFDTGSADLWSFSTLTPVKEQGDHKLYDPSLSGRRDKGYHFNIQYAKGSASGVEYIDTVAAGSLTATADCGAATQVAQVNTLQPQDSIVGFALDNENTCQPTKCFTFFHQIKYELAQQIFAVALKHNGPGIWDFGFIDHTLYTGAITHTERLDYPNAGAWGIYVQAWQVANEKKQKSYFLAVVDTGTTILYLPDPIVLDYYANVPGAAFDFSVGGAVFPCSSISHLPKLSFQINGQQRSMPGGEYGVYTQLNKTYCFGAVQSGDGIGVSILGDMFLRTQYVVFDPINDVVGLAQQKGIIV